MPAAHYYEIRMRLNKAHEEIASIRYLVAKAAARVLQLTSPERAKRQADIDKLIKRLEQFEASLNEALDKL